MKIIRICLLAFSLFSLHVSAQEREIKEEGQTFFKPHAYLQLQGGAAHTLGEAKFSDLISPAAAFNLGYHFTPSFGMRIGATGWQAKGGWVAPSQVYDFTFVQGNIDLLVDFVSLFDGFNPKRAVTSYLFGGASYAYGLENDGANALDLGSYELEYLWKEKKGFLGGRCGVGINFRLSDVVKLTLEGNATLLDDHFNSKKAGNVDWLFNALAGISIHLGKSYKRTQPVYYDLPAAISPPAPASELATSPVPEPVVSPDSPVKPLEQKEFPQLPLIYFAFDEDQVDTQLYAEELSLIVSVLKEFRDTEILIIGYTDHSGSDVYNNALSKRRAEAVKEYLVDKGINAERLFTSGEGKDHTTTGQEALTIKARRVVVKEK